MLKYKILISVLLLGCTTAMAQQQLRLGADSAMMLPGLVIAYEEADEKITVMRAIVMDQNTDYGKLDIQDSDEVLFINGTRVRTLTELMRIYTEVAEEAEVKLGLKRGSERFIRSFVKPTSDQVSQMGGMRFRSGAGPGGGTAIGMTMMGGEGEAGSMALWGGTVISTREDQVIVQHVARAFEGVTLEQGDVIRSINGTDVESGEALNKIYDPLKTGADVTVVIERGDETHTFTFKKPDPSTMPRIRFGSGPNNN